MDVVLEFQESAALFMTDSSSSQLQRNAATGETSGSGWV